MLQPIDHATPGLMAIRFLKSLGASRGDDFSAEAFIRAQGWTHNIKDAVLAKLKAGVATIDSANSGLISMVGADLLAALRPLTVVGRLNLRRLPPYTWMLSQDTPFRAGWVGEGKPIPMSGGGFDRDQLGLKKVAALTVVTNELLRTDLVDAEQSMLSDLLAACVLAIDRAFIDPTNAGTADEPASVTNVANSGATVITSTGATVANIDADLKSAAAALLAQGCTLQTASWIMGERLALAMSLMRGSGGTLAYPDMGILGGELCGLPVLTTAAADTSTSVSRISLIDASQIGYARGEPTLKTSNAAAIDMNSSPGAGSMVTPVSLFQAEATALLAILEIDWVARRPAAATINGIAI